MSVADIGQTVLADMSRAELVARWQDQYGTPPPKGLSRRLLVGAVTYTQQAKLHGGYRPALSRRLVKLVGGAQVTQLAPPRSLSAGTSLVREWNGVTHTVDVVESGYIWNGTGYRSLSAVARAITGARWSGPRFFGIAT
ncbi:MAG: DUF2924 domain-containing protein [Alphaproteobacteria bacterium]|nr:DUF2924 domain-containing protein [Alphaproteobacteria bacterium]